MQTDFCEYFQGKKITVMGLGLLGRGIGDVRFLARCGAKLTVTDLKTREQLADALAVLVEFPEITYVLGEHRLEDFREADLVLKAAGVPVDSPYVAEAKAHDVPVVMSAALFCEFSGVPTIGVTGTRGKSTVTHLIHHTLSTVTEGGEVLLGGNVRGVSNLELLERVGEDSLAVLELDSWQLQGFGAVKHSPTVAVFTNFMDDHLNYYKGDRDAYFADKAQIFLHQEPGDTFVTTPEVFAQAEAYARTHGADFPQEVVIVDESVLPEDWMVPLPGAHNRRNAALALSALRATGLPDEEIRAAFETFPGVPGRLEFIGEYRGVKIFNDNNATTPEATIAGLEALADGQNVVLIMGGADKGSATEALIAAVRTHTKAVELLAGTGTERLRAELPAAPVHDSVEAALAAALEHAENGDVLLFSPAFASFGMFQNEYERSDRFVAAVRALPA